MNTFLKILGVIIIVIGSIVNIAGMDENSISIVVGGGIFVFLGVCILFLNKDH